MKWHWWDRSWYWLKTNDPVNDPDDPDKSCQWPPKWPWWPCKWPWSAPMTLIILIEWWWQPDLAIQRLWNRSSDGISWPWSWIQNPHSKFRGIALYPQVQLEKAVVTGDSLDNSLHNRRPKIEMVQSCERRPDSTRYKSYTFIRIKSFRKRLPRLTDVYTLELILSRNIRFAKLSSQKSLIFDLLSYFMEGIEP